MNENGHKDKTLQNSELVIKPLKKARITFNVSHNLII